jgi:hypothetical protein
LPSIKIHCHVHNRLPLGYPKPKQLKSQFHTIFIEGLPYSSSSHLPIEKKNFRDAETDERMIIKCILLNLTLVDLQLDANNFYLFTYNTFIKIKKKYFLTGAQDSHLQRVTIPEAAYIQLRRRPPEDEQGNARNM